MTRIPASRRCERRSSGATTCSHEEEQQLFARLSVFAGGCTLEAAEEVADADLDTLQSLVEKSLLRFTDERYWMLETIREYAEGGSDDDPSTDGLRRRLAQHVVACSRSETRAGLRLGDAADMFARIEPSTQTFDPRGRARGTFTPTMRAL